MLGEVTTGEARESAPWLLRKSPKLWVVGRPTTKLCWSGRPFNPPDREFYGTTLTATIRPVSSVTYSVSVF